MKVALIGASGAVGIPLTRELASRGHQVTAISTHPEKVPDIDGVTSLAGDADNRETLPRQIAGHDVVISSIQFLKTDHAALIDSVRKSGVPRYFVNGGCGILRVPGTPTRLMDTPDFPAPAARPAESGRSLLRTDPAGDGAELDVPVSSSWNRARWANRSIPSGSRRGADPSGRSALDIARRLRDRDRR